MAASASGAAAGLAEGSCVLCCGELEVVALGRCDHPICYRCSVRMRALCGVRYCAVCREELGQVRPGPAASQSAGPGRSLRAGSGPAWGWAGAAAAGRGGGEAAGRGRSGAAGRLGKCAEWSPRVAASPAGSFRFIRPLLGCRRCDRRSEQTGGLLQPNYGENGI